MFICKWEADKGLNNILSRWCRHIEKSGASRFISLACKIKIGKFVLVDGEMIEVFMGLCW